MMTSTDLPFFWTGPEMAYLAMLQKVFSAESLEGCFNQKMEEEVTNALGAEKGERTENRKGHRAGYRVRILYTRVGPIELKIPKVKFKDKDAEWYPSFLDPRQKISAGMAEEIVSMYINGVPVKKIVKIIERLYGITLSPGTISNLNKKYYKIVEAWRTRAINGDKWTFLHVDAIYIFCRRNGKVQKTPYFIAQGRDEQGKWDILGLKEGTAEDRENWVDFLEHLRERGLSDVHMIIGDGKTDLRPAAWQVFPKARFQHCIVHHHRNVYLSVDGKRRAETAELVKTIYDCQNWEEAMATARQVVKTLRSDGREAAAKKVEAHLHATLSYMAWEDPELWPMIRSNNLLERLNLEVKRRTDVSVLFPNVVSARMLIGARLFQMARKPDLVPLEEEVEVA